MSIRSTEVSTKFADCFGEARDQNLEESYQDLASLLEIHLLPPPDLRESLFSTTPNNTPIISEDGHDRVLGSTNFEWRQCSYPSENFQFYANPYPERYSNIPEEMFTDPNLFRSIACDHSADFMYNVSSRVPPPELISVSSSNSRIDDPVSNSKKRKLEEMN